MSNNIVREIIDVRIDRLDHKEHENTKEQNTVSFLTLELNSLSFLFVHIRMFHVASVRINVTCQKDSQIFSNRILSMQRKCEKNNLDRRD